MRVVIQRVSEATLRIDHKVYSRIDKGLCIFFGVETGADERDLDWLINKIIQLRIFSDTEGKMNLSVQDVEGEIMVVSQFTLHASTKKGNRPSYIRAEQPDRAKSIYLNFIKGLEERIGSVSTGVFGADMQVSLINDGPVTIIIDSELKW